MKKYIYFIALALTAASFASCGHDPNYDGEYDIKGYFNGSDPRNNLVYFTTHVGAFTNNFAGGLHVGEDSQEFPFKAAVTRKLTSAGKAQVALSTDAPLLATTYKDYTVATAEQVEFKDGGIIEIGTETADFAVPITVKGLSQIVKPTVVPVRITPTGDELNSPEDQTQDYGYIVITPKEAWNVWYNKDENISVSMGETNTYLDKTSFAVQLNSAKAFNQKGKIGLERDNSLVKADDKMKLAPEGISTTTAVDCQGKSYLNLSVAFANPDKFAEPGNYVLPMRAVYYDENGGKHNLIGGEVLIPIKVTAIYIAATKQAPIGTLISRDGWQVTSDSNPRYGTMEETIDGNVDTAPFLRKGNRTVIVDMGKSETIKGLQLGMDSDWEYFPSAITFYGSNDNQEWEQLSGSISVSWDLWNNYLILQPLTIRYLKMEVKVTNSYGKISEIKIYK